MGLPRSKGWRFAASASPARSSPCGPPRFEMKWATFPTSFRPVPARRPRTPEGNDLVAFSTSACAAPLCPCGRDRPTALVTVETARAGSARLSPPSAAASTSSSFGFYSLGFRLPFPARIPRLSSRLRPLLGFRLPCAFRLVFRAFRRGFDALLGFRLLLRFPARIPRLPSRLRRPPRVPAPLRSPARIPRLPSRLLQRSWLRRPRRLRRAGLRRLSHRVRRTSLAPSASSSLVVPIRVSASRRRSPAPSSLPSLLGLAEMVVELELLPADRCLEQHAASRVGLSQ